jgi:hypothetical protein
MLTGHNEDKKHCASSKLRGFAFFRRIKNDETCRMIHLKQPKYLNFLKNEQKTLTFLSTNPYIAKKFRQLSEDAKKSLIAYKGVKERHLGTMPFQFNSNFNLLIENDTRRICIEAIATPDYGHVS